MVFGLLAVAKVAWDRIRRPDLSSHGIEHLAVEIIRLIDIFLLSTVLYIVALGLFELFLDPHLPVPPWLRISNLDELKERLVVVIIVLLGVEFLGNVVEWTGGTNILALGAAVALVIAALGVVFVLKPTSRSDGHPPTRE
jgi:uncharacterized membrane protein YqhA